LPGKPVRSIPFNRPPSVRSPTPWRSQPLPDLSFFRSSARSQAIVTASQKFSRDLSVNRKADFSRSGENRRTKAARLLYDGFDRHGSRADIQFVLQPDQPVAESGTSEPAPLPSSIHRSARPSGNSAATVANSFSHLPLRLPGARSGQRSGSAGGERRSLRRAGRAFDTARPRHDFLRFCQFHRDYG
jgi:hypothetical protein